ncbi:MAG: 3'-5' exonuclease [Flavobacteriaceae bacterium]|nr:3'-5' exonuclease [Flavobacteriaceae bacterium]
MMQLLNLHNILFLDIETVPERADFSELSAPMQELFDQKTRYQRKEDQTAQDFYHKAGIWAEFGKIICISVGFLAHSEGKELFRVKSFSGDEAQLLKDFKNLLEQHFYKPEHLLCAHNGKEFDYPYIARRMIINRITVPEKLSLFGKKPWEVAHLDTMEMWRFGDYKNFTSLKLLTAILGIPSPKEDIDGSEVRDTFYEKKDLERIVRYCERDVVAIAQVLLTFQNKALLNEDQIIIVD